MPIVFELARFLITSFGVGLLNEKFNIRPHPPGQIRNKNLVQNLMENRVFPYIAGACIQHPGLIAKPMTKTAHLVGHGIDRVSTTLWGNDNANLVTQKRRSLTEIADYCWLLVDKLITLTLEKPKVVIFCISSTCILFLVLEPVVQNYMEARELKKIERRLTRKLEEERLIKELTEKLAKKHTLSEIISSSSSQLESDFDSLGNQESRIRKALIKVVNPGRR